MQGSAVKLPPTTQEAEGLPRRRWTVAELEQMTEAGILLDDERLELIGGEVVPMSPKGARHEVLKMMLNRRWARLAPDDLLFIPETTFRLSEDTYLEPDFIVWPAGSSAASGAAASPIDEVRALNGKTAVLAVEVADLSLAYDQGRKVDVYARFGVREMWVIDALRLTVRVHREPDEALGHYRQVSDHGAEETLVPKFRARVDLAARGFQSVESPHTAHRSFV